LPKNFTQFICTHQTKVRLSRCFNIFQFVIVGTKMIHIIWMVFICYYDILFERDTHCGPDTPIQGFQFKAIYTLNWLWICLTCNLLNLDLFDSYVIEFQLNQSSKSIISSSIKLAQGFQINPHIHSYFTKLRKFLDSLMYFSFDKMLPTSHFMITIHVQF